MPSHMNNLDERQVREWFQAVEPHLAPPEGCEERVLERALAHAASGVAEAAGAPRKRTWRRWALRGVSTAAALALIAFGVWFFASGEEAAATDFDTMMRKVREARTVTFELTIRTAGRPDSRALESLRGDGKHRVDWESGRVQIKNQPEGLSLVVNPKTRTATLISMQPPGPGYSTSLDQILRVANTPGERVGSEEVDGRKADIFLVRRSDATIRIWADVATSLPVRLEIRPAGDDDQEAVWIMERFRWNVPLEDSLFAMEAPQGYEFKSLLQDSTEDHLIEMLRVVADLNDGRLPDELDFLAQVDALKASMPGAEAGVHLRKEGMSVGVSDEEYTRQVRKLIWGFWFIRRVESAGDDAWGYVGAGVRPGDASAPVCWWRTADTGTRRILYGDMRIEETTEEDLPLPASPAETR